MKIDTLQEALELIKSDDKPKFDKFFNELSKDDKYDLPRICQKQNWNVDNANIDLEEYKNAK